jgi:DNA-binding SARP family transcriptional activator
MNRRDTAGFEVRLLGGLTVVADQAVQRLPPNEARLVAYLAVSLGAVAREVVADTLWAAAGIDRAAASLRTTLWRLGLQFPGLVLAERTHLALADAVAVDAVAARDLARRVITEPTVAAATDVRTLEADLLPELYDDWAVLEHERYRQQRLHALEAVTRACVERAWWGRALDAAATVVRADPFRESAHRVLIEVHLAEGNLVEARRAYERCHRLFMEELGVGPSPLLHSLVQRVPAHIR